MKKYETLTQEQREAKIDKYAEITINFGKHKGKTLGDIHNKDPNYLVWLKNTSKVDDKTSPTMLAILKYCTERI
jgi:uncharacterized protein (DUF3820 family)